MAGSTLEDRIRRLVRRRLRRGEQRACAAAASHKAPWLSKWLAGDLSATLDELQALTAFVRLSLGKVIEAPDGSPLDWEVFGLMGLLKDERKRIARDLIERVADDAVLIVAPESRPRATPRRRLGGRTVR